MSDEKETFWRLSIIVIVKPRYLDAVRENAHFQNRQVYISYTTGLKMSVDKAMRQIARFYFMGRIVGNNKTSLIDAESVSTITIRSIPMPTPPVGGIPYSSAVQKSSS